MSIHVSRLLRRHKLVMVTFPEYGTSSQVHFWHRNARHWGVAGKKITGQIAGPLNAVSCLPEFPVQVDAKFFAKCLQTADSRIWKRIRPGWAHQRNGESVS